MTINLNQSPYFDDFDVEKNYTKILAVPGRVSQAREATQAQSIIQNQIVELGNTIYTNGRVISGCILTISSDKSLVSISQGSIYVDGRIIKFATDASVSIDGVGVEVIGIVKTEEVITELSDSSLLDPHVGYENYGEPGAHRLKETWNWAKINDDGIGVFTLYDGAIQSQTKSDPIDPKPVSQTENVLDIIARRDYQKSGNYVLSGLKCSLYEHPDTPLLYKKLKVDAGTARLLGYDTTIIRDTYYDVPIASETNTNIREPWLFVRYDSSTGLGGQFRLGNRPVAYIDRIAATYLVVDGDSGRPQVTRGAIRGGLDELSEASVVSIIAVNLGGTWNPATESFIGGTTYSSTAYTLVGNKISWSPEGNEPEIGSFYNVAYKALRVIDKELFAPVRVLGEIVTHGDVLGNDKLSYDFICEDNTFTDFPVYITRLVSPVPDFDSDFTPTYTNGVDYVIGSLGEIEWYDYETQILEVTKGTANGVDGLTGFLNNYTMGTILDVAYYADSENMEFDRSTNKFISYTSAYTLTTDYTYTKGNPQINWGASGAEPTTGYTYFVAIKVRTYKTSNHPSLGERVYASYYYWNTVVAGDYVSRDSFYKTWIAEDNAGNELQRFGLDLQDYVNFWRSTSYKSGSGNYNRPYPNSLVEVDYQYYLPRYILVSVNSDDPIKLLYGQSSEKPTEPTYTDDPGNLPIARIYCPADSAEMAISNLGVQTIKVVDLHQMKSQITTNELNLASTWLDIDAKSIPITNKRGVMTTSFTNDTRIDSGWAESAYTIDPSWEELAMPHIDSFYSVTVDSENTTAQLYQTLCSVVPNGTNYIEQTNYTGDESIAPYALAGQSALGDAPSAYMSISPTGDTLIIPRTLEGFTSEADANRWISSDVSKLSNPTQWFSKGWTGGVETRSFYGYDAYRGAAYLNHTESVVSSSQTQTFTASYIRDIQGNCRQIEVAWNIPGGLMDPNDVELDYFIYFGGVQVIPTLTNGTPPGEVTGTFRPIPYSRSATGTFMIPPNIPEGRVEVKVVSTPVSVTDEYGTISEWRQIVVCVYDAAVVEQLTIQYTTCRCNCYCNCWCNCYDCRGRCGTGPLAQTIEPIGRKRVLKEIEIDFSKVHPTFGVFGCLIRTDNGQPTSNTISTGMVARKFLTASQLAGAGKKTFTFDDPLFMDDEAYAIVVTGEDGFNLNSIREVAAGRDIRCKIATLGEKDINTNLTVGAQPFKAGILWRSLTGVTWEQDQKADLAFKATFNTYPTNTPYYVYMNPVTVENATAFLCTWDSTVYDGTSITFEYKTPTGRWTEFTPYSLTYIDEVSNRLEFRAKLITQVATITPFVTQFGGLYIQSQETVLKAITKNFEVSELADTCDIFLDSHLPSGCEQHIGITFDSGVSWINLDNNVDGYSSGNLIEYSPVDLNVNNVKYRHHWRVSLDSPNTFSALRVGIVCYANGSSARLKDPRFSRLIVIASNS